MTRINGIISIIGAPQMVSSTEKKAEKAELASSRVVGSPPIISPPLRLESIKNAFDPKIIETRLSNPDLNPEDFSLLNEYFYAAFVDHDAKHAEGIKSLIKGTFTELLKLEIDTYNGRISLVRSELSKRIQAMNLSIEALGCFDDSDSLEISLDVYDRYLSAEEKEGLSLFRAGDIDAKNWVLQRIAEYNANLSQANWMTKDKIKLTQSSNAFRQMAVNYGISDSEIAEIDLKNFDGLNSEDIELLIKSNNAASTPEYEDNEEIIPQLLSNIENKYSDLLRFFNENRFVDPMKFSELWTPILMYIGQASLVGVTKEQITSIFKKVDSEIPLRTFEEVSIAEINRSGKRNAEGKLFAYVVTPESMPGNLRGLFELVEMKPGYSYYQFVKDNVKFIVFNPNIVDRQSEEMSGGSPGGNSAGILPIVQIDTFNEETNQAHSVWLLFTTLVHETAHAAFAKEYFDNHDFYQSTIDEANAFYNDLAASNKLLNVLSNSISGERMEKIRSGIMEQIVPDLGAVNGAMQILGIKEEKNLKDIDRLSFTINHDQDFDVYPTFAPAVIATSYALAFLKKGLITDEQMEPCIRIFSKIVSGKSIDSLKLEEKNIVQTIGSKLSIKYKNMTISEIINKVKEQYTLFYACLDMLNKEISDMEKIVKESEGKGQKSSLSNRQLLENLNRYREHFIKTGQNVDARALRKALKTILLVLKDSLYPKLDVDSILDDVENKNLADISDDDALKFLVGGLTPDYKEGY
ncbi:MAG: hypothetical protein NT030_08360 [Candidatus Saganbacteria bacterium]|nr:hypothetical protein [Candidatus Saganbacteria bacterium]